MPGRADHPRVAIRPRNRWFSCIVALWAMSGLATASSADLPHVLVVNSYHQGMPWNDAENRGLLDIISTKSDPVIVPLDIKRFPDRQREPALVGLLINAVATSHPVAIVTTDDYAYELVLKHYQQLGANLPIIFGGVNHRPTTIPPGVTGVVESIDLANTIDLAFRLHPQAQRLVIVNDTTETGLANAAALADASNHWQGRTLLQLGDASFSDTEQALEQLSASHDVVLLLSWNRDRTGAVRTYQDAVESAHRHCPAPLYGVWSFYLGSGIVGGHLLDGQLHGQEIGKLVLRILTGEMPERIPVINQCATLTALDHRETERFQIPKALIPPEAAIINQPYDFLHEHRIAITVGILVLLIQSGSIIWLVITMAQRRRAERSVIASERRLRSLFDGSPIGMFRSVPSGQFQAVNQAFSTMLGYASPEVMVDQVNHQGIAQCLYESSGKRRILIDELISQLGQWRIEEITFKRSDGSLMDALLTVALLSDPLSHEPVLFGFVQDLTARKRRESEGRRTERLTALGQLSGGVAHDFNNMLVGIMGFADAIVRRTTDERIKRHAELIVDATLRAKDLTGSLLRFARQGSNTPTNFDAHAAITAALELFAAAGVKQIHIDQALTTESAMISGFPAQWQNAILNLCLNARDAMPLGGTLRISSEIVTLDDIAVSVLQPYQITAGPHLRVQVRDSGTGMPPDILARCLEPFFTTKGDNGTGLGLPSVHGTIRDHHGAMRVTSTVGIGTTFELYVPLHTDPPPPSVEAH